METNSAIADREKQEAERLIATVTLPPEIVKSEVRIGDDSTGDPAMWVILWVRKGLRFDQKTADRLNKAAEEVQRKLMTGAFSRFPYTTLDQAA